MLPSYRRFVDKRMERVMAEPVNLDDAINGEARDAASAIATKMRLEGHVNERVSHIIYLAAWPRIATALRNIRVSVLAEQKEG